MTPVFYLSLAMHPNVIPFLLSNAEVGSTLERPLGLHQGAVPSEVLEAQQVARRREAQCYLAHPRSPA